MDVPIKYNHIRAYIRCSTLKQEISPEHQLETIKQYVKYKGFDNIPLTIYSDLGISGSSVDKRFNFQRLMGDLQKCDLVVTYSLSRISRAIKQTIEFFNTLQVKGCHFTSLTENLENQTAIGKFYINLLASLNSYEVSLISERVSNSMCRLARENKLKRRASYGYKPKLDDNGKKIKNAPHEMNDEEQEIMNKVVSYWDKDLMSMSQIARRLNLEGVKCGKALEWRTINVKNILLRKGIIDPKKY